MAPGKKIFSLFLLTMTISGAVVFLNAQTRTPSRTDGTGQSTRDRLSGTTTDDRRTADRGRTGDSDHKVVSRLPGRPLTPPSPEEKKRSDSSIPTTVLATDRPVQPVRAGFRPPEPEQPEPVRIDEDFSFDYPVDYIDGWAPRLKSAYTASMASYGPAAHILLPASSNGNTEFFFRTGGVLFMKSPDFHIDGNTFGSESGLIPFTLVVKNIHYSVTNSYGEYRFYSLAGGGPVLGFAIPGGYDEGETVRHTRWGFAGELSGSVGAEFVINNAVGYFAEIGVTYLQFASGRFSSKPNFISPTLSLGIRFY